MKVTPTSLTFNGVAGTTAPIVSHMVTITELESGTWSARKAQSWLKVKPISGVDGASFEVSVSVGQLAVGELKDTIIVEAEGHEAAHVAITFVVAAAPAKGAA